MLANVTEVHPLYCRVITYCNTWNKLVLYFTIIFLKCFTDFFKLQKLKEIVSYLVNVSNEAC